MTLLLAVAIPIVLMCTGLALWWPARLGKPSPTTDLGLAVLGGAVVAFSVLVVQVSVERRIVTAQEREAARDQQAEAQAAAVADRQNLQLTITLAPTLRRIDLRGRDLSGFYLRRRDMTQAFLIEANLKEAFLLATDLDKALALEANLEGAVLAHASLRQAHLMNASLRGADLSFADFTAAHLCGADLRDTTTDGAVFRRAIADETTFWPEELDREAADIVIGDCG